MKIEGMRKNAELSKMIRPKLAYVATATALNCIPIYPLRLSWLCKSVFTLIDIPLITLIFILHAGVFTHRIAKKVVKPLIFPEPTARSEGY